MIENNVHPLVTPWAVWGGAIHELTFGKTIRAFTDPEANDAEDGAIYDEIADRCVWQAGANFLTELFLRSS